MSAPIPDELWRMAARMEARRAKEAADAMRDAEQDVPSLWDPLGAILRLFGRRDARRPEYDRRRELDRLASRSLLPPATGETK